jgi:hypothetical protein
MAVVNDNILCYFVSPIGTDEGGALVPRCALWTPRCGARGDFLARGEFWDFLFERTGGFFLRDGSGVCALASARLF